MSDLPAGRELDALVAEKVMGDTRFRQVPRAQWYLVLDHYSTDIAAAWLVVENAVGRGMPAGINVAMNWAGDPDGYVAEWAGVRELADTAPLAICRAALRAVGESC